MTSHELAKLLLKKEDIVIKIGQRGRNSALKLDNYDDEIFDIQERKENNTKYIGLYSI